ncbi:MAG: PaaI family thioesterase, partial [Chitinivibrionales bacterium]
TFLCTGRHQGYDNLVHGGVIASLVDASMAQCLMGHGVVAYTAELHVKYRKPVLIDEAVMLQTSIQSDVYKKIFTLKTSIRQNRTLCVTASAKFFRPGSSQDTCTRSDCTKKGS